VFESAPVNLRGMYVSDPGGWGGCKRGYYLFLGKGIVSGSGSAKHYEGVRNVRRMFLGSLFVKGEGGKKWEEAGVRVLRPGIRRA